VDQVIRLLQEQTLNFECMDLNIPAGCCSYHECV